MPLAETMSRGSALYWRLAVNGIQCAERSGRLCPTAVSMAKLRNVSAMPATGQRPWPTAGPQYERRRSSCLALVARPDALDHRFDLVAGPHGVEPAPATEAPHILRRMTVVTDIDVHARVPIVGAGWIPRTGVDRDGFEAPVGAIEKGARRVVIVWLACPQQGLAARQAHPVRIVRQPALDDGEVACRISRRPAPVRAMASQEVLDLVFYPDVRPGWKRIVRHRPGKHARRRQRAEQRRSDQTSRRRRPPCSAWSHVRHAQRSPAGRIRRTTTVTGPLH